MASTLNATGYTITSSNTATSIVLRDASQNFLANTPTFIGLKFSGSALSGTNNVLSFDSTYTKGNYVNIGGGGRNLGIANNGPVFFSFNLDYNASTNQYVYNSTNPAFAISLGTSSGPVTGQLSYAASGTVGTNATVSNALTWDTTGAVTFPNGNIIFSTAGNGLTIKSATVSAGTANAYIVKGAVLVGGTVTVNNSFITSSHVGLPVAVVTGGTRGALLCSCGSGTFTVTSSSGTDTSTVDVVFFLGN